MSQLNTKLSDITVAEWALRGLGGIIVLLGLGLVIASVVSGYDFHTRRIMIRVGIIFILIGVGVMKAGFRGADDWKDVT